MTQPCRANGLAQHCGCDLHLSCALRPPADSRRAPRRADPSTALPVVPLAACFGVVHRHLNGSTGSSAALIADGAAQSFAAWTGLLAGTATLTTSGALNTNAWGWMDILPARPLALSPAGLTLSAWVYPFTPRTSSAAVWSLSDGGSQNYVTLYWQPSGNSLNTLWLYATVSGGGSSTMVSSSTTLSVRAWSHVAVTVDAFGNVGVFVNGMAPNGFQSISTASSLFSATGLAAAVGSGAGGMANSYQPVRALIADAQVYSYALTPAAIAQLAGVATMGGACAFAAPPPSPSPPPPNSPPPLPLPPPLPPPAPALLVPNLACTGVLAHRLVLNGANATDSVGYPTWNATLNGTAVLNTTAGGATFASRGDAITITGPSGAAALLSQYAPGLTVTVVLSLAAAPPVGGSTLLWAFASDAATASAYFALWAVPAAGNASGAVNFLTSWRTSPGAGQTAQSVMFGGAAQLGGWHRVSVTLAPNAVLSLFVDGGRVAMSTAPTSGNFYSFVGLSWPVAQLGGTLPAIPFPVQTAVPWKLSELQVYGVALTNEGALFSGSAYGCPTPPAPPPPPPPPTTRTMCAHVPQEEVNVPLAEKVMYVHASAGGGAAAGVIHSDCMPDTSPEGNVYGAEMLLLVGPTHRLPLTSPITAVEAGLASPPPRAQYALLVALLV